MAILDFHTHIFPAEVVRHRAEYLRQDPAFHALYSDTRAALATAEDLVAAMDRAGIERSVACGFGWSAPDLCRAGNDAIIEAVQRYPQRITGFGTIAPHASLAHALAEIERLAAAGIGGLGELRPDAQGLFEMAPEELATLAGAVREKGMALLLHASEPVGHSYPGKEAATPDRLERLLPAFVGMPVVLAHGGGGLPFYALMPEVQKALTTVYVDTAALPLLYRPEVLRVFITILGLDRVLFGSDYPLMAPERALAYLERGDLTQAERDAILGDNAARLLAALKSPAWRTASSPTS